MMDYNRICNFSEREEAAGAERLAKMRDAFGIAAPQVTEEKEVNGRSEAAEPGRSRKEKSSRR